MGLKFETRRLLLRPYAHSDGDAVWPVVRRPEIYATTAYIPRRYPRARVDWWIDFIQSAAKNRTGYEFAVIEKASGRYVGNVGLINVRLQMKSASVSYFIDPAVWGRGYATEACGEMLRFGFERLGLFRIGGTCMVKNPASRRVMEKLGFLFEGVARAELLKDGEFYDIAHLSLLRDEWRARQRGRLPR